MANLAAPYAQPPPDLPSMPDSIPTQLVQYLRTFSLWCKQSFDNKLSSNSALPGIMLQSTDTTTPVSYQLSTTQAGQVTLAQTALGTGKPGAAVPIGPAAPPTAPDLSGYVRKTGDEMSGDLTIDTNLTVNGGLVSFANVGNDGFIVTGTGASDPMMIGVPNGAYARIMYNIDDTRLWSCGAAPDGNFKIADESEGQFIFILGYWGQPHNLNGGDLNINNGSLYANGMVTAQERVDAIANFNGRQGINGATANGFNFYWSGSALQGWVDTSNLGNVSFTSDYRIKKDVKPLGGMWDRVKALKPVSYSHKDYTPPNAPDQLFRADDKERWGFVAHELQETLIEDAATGVKDDPKAIQSPNPWTMIAVLTKTIQEMQARLEALEAAR